MKAAHCHPEGRTNGNNDRTVGTGSMNFGGGGDDVPAPERCRCCLIFWKSPCRFFIRRSTSSPECPTFSPTSFRNIVVERYFFLIWKISIQPTQLATVAAIYLICWKTDKFPYNDLCRTTELVRRLDFSLVSTSIGQVVVRLRRRTTPR